MSTPPPSPPPASSPLLTVSCIAYRDPELVPTLQSLFQQAEQPSRIRVAVVWQGGARRKGEKEGQEQTPSSAGSESSGEDWTAEERRLLQLDAALQVHTDELEGEDVALLAELDAFVASLSVRPTSALPAAASCSPATTLSLPSSDPLVRQLLLPHTEARGPCYARYLAQRMLMGRGWERLQAERQRRAGQTEGREAESAAQSVAPSSSVAIVPPVPSSSSSSPPPSSSLPPADGFYLQLDSHMRFARGWDTMLMEQWEACKDPKAILTMYPPGYERGGKEEESGGKQGEMEGVPVPPTLLCASHFHPSDGMLRLVGRQLQSCPPAPLPTPFLAAGFTFGPMSLVDAAPYDPHLLNVFFGEESSWAARLFTAGYRFFTPTRTLVWHCWSRSYRPSFRHMLQQASEEERRRHQRLEQIGMRRVRAVLGMTAPPSTTTQAVGVEEEPLPPLSPADASDPSLDASLCTPLAPYTLGSVRTLADFYESTGVDFARRTLTQRAKDGGVEPRFFKRQVQQSQLDLVMQLVMQQQQQQQRKS